MGKKITKLSDGEKSERFLQMEPSIIKQQLVKGEMQIKLVSPKKLILFWDTSDLPKKLIHLYFNGKFAEFTQVIRIYDVTQINFNGKNAHHFYEIAVPFEQGYWFVKGLFQNRSYLAEIGVKMKETEFFPLLRSNSVQTPKMEVTQQNQIYQDVFQLQRYEERPPKWRDHVSTYSYYIQPKTAENINGHNDERN